MPSKKADEQFANLIRQGGENDSNDNILSFAKGDRFEVLDSNKRSIEWWGARALKDNSVGYVPSKYLKYEERRIGKLNSESNDHKILREKSLKRLADIRQSAEYKPPDEVYPDIPSPDYDASSDEEENEINYSISKNGSLDTSLNGPSDDECIEDVCPALPEPDPDYLYEEEDSLDSPVLRAGRQDVTIIQVGNRNHSGSTDYDDNRMTSEHHHRARYPSESDGQGLILPKKLPNPCLESKERTALHRELLMNNKLGKNVLKKSELQKKLMEREDMRKRKEFETYKLLKRSSLEIQLEERANRLKKDEAENMKSISEDTSNRSEFSKVHAKITARACDQ
ncbi:uncharacterized protein LOC135471023 [Liolophura sinensis]|uniref:uncharacterized protein LOC135471023 n=1 Tax=Liolophura sinensis TaxID=3198878 RepID=UPI003158684C